MSEPSTPEKPDYDAELRDAIESIPEVAEMLAGDSFQSAFVHDLITGYVENVNEQIDAALGDLDNWKPTGFLGATNPEVRAILDASKEES